MQRGIHIHIDPRHQLGNGREAGPQPLQYLPLAQQAMGDVLTEEGWAILHDGTMGRQHGA